MIPNAPPPFPAMRAFITAQQLADVRARAIVRFLDDLTAADRAVERVELFRQHEGADLSDACAICGMSIECEARLDCSACAA